MISCQGLACEGPACAFAVSETAPGCRVRDRVREETGPSPGQELTAANGDAICTQEARDKSVGTKATVRSLPPDQPWQIRARS